MAPAPQPRAMLAFAVCHFVDVLRSAGVRAECLRLAAHVALSYVFARTVVRCRPRVRAMYRRAVWYRDAVPREQRMRLRIRVMALRLARKRRELRRVERALAAASRRCDSPGGDNSDSETPGGAGPGPSSASGSA